MRYGAKEIHLKFFKCSEEMLHCSRASRGLRELVTCKLITKVFIHN
jgi:hypothetical protein